jgi:AraC family transcriptional regulator
MKKIFVMAEMECLACYKVFPYRDGTIELLPITCSLEAIRNADPDILLIDCGYEDGIGLVRLSEIKNQRPDLPVIFLTDAGSEATAVAAFRMGARDYFKKPVDLFLLRNRIASIVQARKESREWRLPLPAGNCEKIPAGCGSVTTESSPGILRAVCHIENNLTGNVTVDDLADKAGMSKYHFCRAFKKATGVSPIMFVNARRVALAKELLGREDLTISTVALKSGFNDFSNFNRSFKIMTGLTPTAYRDCVKQRDLSGTFPTLLLS